MLQLVFTRKEIKYLITDEQRKRLEELMDPYVVEDTWGPCTVCNVYYDTPTHLMIRRCMEHPEYREKIRVRSYGVRQENEPVFLELKKKCEGVAYKRRCEIDEDAARNMLSGHGSPSGQIESELDATIRRYGGLEPAAYIAYDRVAYYARDDRDFRMTFDRRVRARWDRMQLNEESDGELLLADGWTLLEIKTTGALPLWLTHFLSKEKLYKAAFSKYGLAWERQLKKEGFSIPRNSGPDELAETRAEFGDFPHAPSAYPDSPYSSLVMCATA